MQCRLLNKKNPWYLTDFAPSRISIGSRPWATLCRNNTLIKINGTARSLMLKQRYYEEWDLNCCVDDSFQKFGESKCSNVKLGRTYQQFMCSEVIFFVTPSHYKTCFFLLFILKVFPRVFDSWEEHFLALSIESFFF